MTELITHYQRYVSLATCCMGNEGGFPSPLDRELYETAKSLNPQLLVLHNDGGNNTRQNSDFKTGPMSPWNPGAIVSEVPFVAHEYLNLTAKADPRLDNRFTGAYLPSLAALGLDRAGLDRLCTSLPLHVSGLDIAPRDTPSFEEGLRRLRLNRAWGDACVDAGHALQRVYQKQGIEMARLAWTLRADSKQLAASTLASGDVDVGTVRELGTWSFTVPPLTRPVHAVLEARLTAQSAPPVSNRWDCWFFPVRENKSGAGLAATLRHFPALSQHYTDLARAGTPDGDQATVLIASEGDPEVMPALEAGRRVLLLDRCGAPDNVRLGWWLFGNQTGTAMARHPVFGDFPHDGTLSPLWFNIVKRPELLRPDDGFCGAEPLMVGDGLHGHSLYLCQARVENGRLIRACGLDVLSGAPEGTALLDAMLAYARSDDFTPKTALDPGALKTRWLRHQRRTASLNGWARTVTAASSSPVHTFSGLDFTQNSALGMMELTVPRAWTQSGAACVIRLNAAEQYIHGKDIDSATNIVIRVLKMQNISTALRGAAYACAAECCMAMQEDQGEIANLARAREHFQKAISGETDPAKRQWIIERANKVIARSKELRGEHAPVQTAQAPAPPEAPPADRPAAKLPTGKTAAPSLSRPVKKAPQTPATLPVSDQAVLDEALRRARKSASACLAEAKTFLKAEKYGDENVAAIKAVFDVYKAGGNPLDGLAFMESCLDQRRKYGLGEEDQVKLWNDFGYESFLCISRENMLKAQAALDKLGGEMTGYFAYRGGTALQIFEDMETFPKSEAEIVFPQTLAGFKNKKPVYAKDFGWNPDNATAALQKALASEAATVIVDNMGSPWHISSVSPRSNQTIIFRKGVRILNDADTRNNPSKDVTLFVLNACQNLMFIGEGDVVIGKYKDREERFKYAKGESGSGFTMNDCKNITLRNLTISECTTDGICMGGVRNPNTDIYLEDVVLDSNARQTLTIGNVNGVYMRRVTFSRTGGTPPSLGIDLENSYEVMAQANIYLFDCSFSENHAGDLNFSNSSYHPVTLYAKRCTFEPNLRTQLRIMSRCGVYMNNGIAAPSKIILDSCTFKSYSEGVPICFATCSLFNVRFINSKIIDIGPHHANGSALAPISFALNRDFSKQIHDWRDDKFEGSITFENVEIKGFKDAPLVSYDDPAGVYSIQKIGGSVTHNGRKIDMSQFRYKAPDAGRPDVAPLDTAALLPPTKPAPKRIASAPCNLIWRAPWYSAAPEYTLVFYGKKRDKASFTLVYGTESNIQDASLKVKGPTGEELDLGAFKMGDNVFSITYPETGFYTMKPPMTYTVKDMEGVAFAYYPASSEQVGKIVTNAQGEYTGYFEVPAGKGAVFVKTMENMVLVTGKGKPVDPDPSLPGQTGARRYTLKQGQRPQIYGLYCRAGRGSVRFYAPLNGIWADDPDYLPRMK